MKNALLVLSGILPGIALALLLCGGSGTAPSAEAQTAGEPSSGAQIIMATGGSAPNMNDLCWILIRDQGTDPDGRPCLRTTLSLYKAHGGGRLLDLVDTRETTYDNKPAQLNIPGHNLRLSPSEMKTLWEQKLKEAKERRKANQSR